MKTDFSKAKFSSIFLYLIAQHWVNAQVYNKEIDNDYLNNDIID